MIKTRNFLTLIITLCFYKKRCFFLGHTDNYLGIKKHDVCNLQANGSGEKMCVCARVHRGRERLTETGTDKANGTGYKQLLNLRMSVW